MVAKLLVARARAHGFIFLPSRDNINDKGARNAFETSIDYDTYETSSRSSSSKHAERKSKTYKNKTFN
jgi:hypothetical protein